MKKLVSSIHLPIFIFGSIVIFVAGLIALLVVLNPVQVQAFVNLVSRPFQSVDLVSSNTVEVYREQNTLRIKFQIIPGDLEKFNQLSTRLGISTNWQEGIDFGLDEASMNLIEPYLPLKSDVRIEGDEIKLQGSSFNFLPSGGVGDEVSFATNGGTLRYADGTSELEVFMDQPAVLVSYATASGKLNLSRKIESDLFSLAGKIDTIDLKVKGKSVEGKIVLR